MRVGAETRKERRVQGDPRGPWGPPSKPSCAGWCRRRPVASKPKPLQTLSLPFKIFRRVVIEDLVSAQELFDLMAGFEREKAAEIGLVQTSKPILLGGERFECTSIRNLDRYIHAFTVS